MVTCNAYFAQLGTYDVGAEALHDTATLLGIAASSPDTAAELKKALAQSAYGQGEVVASPFQMARVAATVANGGLMPQGRWLTDENNARISPPAAILPADAAAHAGALHARGGDVGHGAAGRGGGAGGGQDGHGGTGGCPSHAWFIGFAPYGGAGAQDRVLGSGGEWSVRRHGGGSGRGGDGQRGREIGADSAMSLFSEIEKTIERGFHPFAERMFGPADSERAVAAASRDSGARSKARCR